MTEHTSKWVPATCVKRLIAEIFSRAFRPGEFYFGAIRGVCSERKCRAALATRQSFQRAEPTQRVLLATERLCSPIWGAIWKWDANIHLEAPPCPAELVPTSRRRGAARAVRARRASAAAESSQQQWWRQVMADYALEPHHLNVLEAACDAWDRMVEARTVLARERLVVTTKSGTKRHPCADIERDSRLAFARLVRELDLDCEPPRETPGWRPPSLRSNRRR